MKKFISAVMSLAITSSFVLGNFSGTGMSFSVSSSAISLDSETSPVVNATDGEVAIGFSRDGWKDSYRQVLEYYKNLDGIKFNLIYLDDNDIPELIITDSACRLTDFNAPDEYADTKYGTLLITAFNTEYDTTLVAPLVFRYESIESINYLERESYCKFPNDSILYHLENENSTISLDSVGNYTDEEKTINESFNNSSNVKISYIQHKLNEETLESILNGENAERPDKCGENAFWSLDEGTGTLTISGSGEQCQQLKEIK